MPITDFTVKKDVYNNEIICLRLIGAIDAFTVKRLDRAADEVMKGKLISIILDLSALSFIGSSGIGIIVALFTHVGNRQGKLILAGIQPQVKTVFDELGFSKLFNFAPDVMAARKLME